MDRQGNFNYGFRENTAFPEVRPDEVEMLHGLEITISTDAGTYEKGFALFKQIGFPFKE